MSKYVMDNLEAINWQSTACWSDIASRMMLQTVKIIIRLTIPEAWETKMARSTFDPHPHTSNEMGNGGRPPLHLTSLTNCTSTYITVLREPRNSLAELQIQTHWNRFWGEFPRLFFSVECISSRRPAAVHKNCVHLIGYCWIPSQQIERVSQECPYSVHTTTAAFLSIIIIFSS